MDPDTRLKNTRVTYQRATITPFHDIIRKEIEKAIQGIIIAKFFTDRATEDYESMKLDFSDEELMAISGIKDKDEEETWRMYFDGATNVMGHEIEALLISLTEYYYPMIARLNFNCTNNVTEYEACAMRLHAALVRKIETLKVSRDLTLVIYQLKNEWETRDSKLIPYHKYILELCKQFESIKFKHLPCEDNQIVNALATLAAMVQLGNIAEIQPIKLDVRDMPVHCANLEEEKDGNPWYIDIM
ncbi:uncharacterized protein LOC111292444 [Durio zibethinus]|uniref:Uncharacterized protein LOC111292444 n=1 Tax=Durio zibethinus TaxID=66656 RepID=A0A6P5YJT3_DURZI|nr:uncharacterized protein LOC111292444 [Durio zibethinus]